MSKLKNFDREMTRKQAETGKNIWKTGGEDWQWRSDGQKQLINEWDKSHLITNK